MIYTFQVLETSSIFMDTIDHIEHSKVSQHFEGRKSNNIHNRK